MDCFVENHFRMNECALTCERWLTRGRLCVWTDLSRQQGGAGQPDAGWCHRRHRWRQHRGDDSPGGPEQNQDGKLQPGTHHVQVRTDSSLLTLPVCNSFLFVLLLSGAQMLMWKRKPFRPHTGDSYTCQSLRSHWLVITRLGRQKIWRCLTVFMILCFLHLLFALQKNWSDTITKKSCWV